MSNAYQRKQLILLTEDSKDVFFRGKYVSRIALSQSELIIGRRDVLSGFYPDVDLAMYKQQDPGIACQHLRIFRDLHGQVFAEKLSPNASTFVNHPKLPILEKRFPLKLGDRLIISESIVFQLLEQA